LRNLEYLNCSNNLITHMFGVVLPKLKVLKCDTNSLVVIKDLHLPNLKSLSCYYNPLNYTLDDFVSANNDFKIIK